MHLRAHVSTHNLDVHNFVARIVARGRIEYTVFLF